jgi:hypothetical protein
MEEKRNQPLPVYLASTSYSWPCSVCGSPYRSLGDTEPSLAQSTRQRNDGPCQCCICREQHVLLQRYVLYYSVEKCQRKKDPIKSMRLKDITGTFHPMTVNNTTQAFHTHPECCHCSPANTLPGRSTTLTHQPSILHRLSSFFASFSW